MVHSLSIDFLIRLKNASLAGRQTLAAPHSRLVENIAAILQKHNYITGFSVSASSPKTINVELSASDSQSKINHVTIFSKPSRRLYQKSSSIPWGKTPASLIIISTSKGLMSHKEAKKTGLGGELIAEIY